MEALVFPLASLLIFLILTETVTVRLYNTRGLKADIGLRIFALELSPKTSGRPQKKSRNKRKNDKSLKKVLKFILKRSHFEVDELTVLTTDLSPFTYFILDGVLHLIYAIVGSIVRFFFANSDFDNINFLSSANTNPEIKFDVKISFSAITLIRGLLLYVLLSLKTLKEKII